jgi:hypothetical protein
MGTRAQPHLVQCFQGTRRRLWGGSACIEERQFHLALGAGARQQVETLKDKPDLAIREIV